MTTLAGAGGDAPEPTIETLDGGGSTGDVSVLVHNVKVAEENVEKVNAKREKFAALLDQVDASVTKCLSDLNEAKATLDAATGAGV